MPVCVVNAGNIFFSVGVKFEDTAIRKGSDDFCSVLVNSSALTRRSALAKLIEQLIY